MKNTLATFASICMLALLVINAQCFGKEDSPIPDLANSVAIVRALNISELEKSLDRQSFGEFLDELLELGEQSNWSISDKCSLQNFGKSICLEYVSETEADTTAILRISCISIGSKSCGHPRIQYAKYGYQTISSATPIKTIRATHKVANHERHFDLSTIEIRKSKHLAAGYQIIGSKDFGFEKHKDFLSVVSILDSIWIADICGTNDDTLDLKLVLLKNKKDGIDAVKTTNISMYSDGDAIPRLMKLGKKLSKKIKNDIALQIIHTGSPECKE